MGNSRSNYERHEDDEQQQRIVIGKEFRLVLGQLNLPKEKKLLLNSKGHRKLSSSSSNSTITSSSSSDHPHSSVAFIQFDIPTSPFDSNEFDTHSLIQYLFQEQTNGKVLSHIFQIPFSIELKSQLKTLPTLQIAAIYYEQLSTTNELNIESISLIDENKLEENLVEKFNQNNILSIYTSKSTAYIIYTKHFSRDNKYKLIHSTTMSKTALENFEWLQPFIDYSNLGYRLCGIIP